MKMSCHDSKWQHELCMTELTLSVTLFKLAILDCLTLFYEVAFFLCDWDQLDNEESTKMPTGTPAHINKIIIRRCPVNTVIKTYLAALKTTKPRYVRAFFGTIKYFFKLLCKSHHKNMIYMGLHSLFSNTCQSYMFVKFTSFFSKMSLPVLSLAC